MKNCIKFFFSLTLLVPSILHGQSTDNWITSPGIIGTAVLIIIVLAVAVMIVSMRVNHYLKHTGKEKIRRQQLEFSEDLINMQQEDLDEILIRRKKALQYRLKGEELGSHIKGKDEKGLIAKLTNQPDNPLIDEKKKVARKPRNSGEA